MIVSVGGVVRAFREVRLPQSGCRSPAQRPASRRKHALLTRCGIMRRLGQWSIKRPSPNRRQTPSLDTHWTQKA